MSEEFALEKKLPVVRGWKLIVGYLGFILMLIGGILFLPILVIPFFPEEITEIFNFLIPSIVSLLVGGGLFFSLTFHKRHGQLKIHQDAVIVVGSWILCILISAIPFTLGGTTNYLQGILEATSGYTTTGVSVIIPEDVDNIYLMWRSITQFFGGIGLVLVMISAFSDRHAMRLYSAEGHSDRLLPNLLKSSRAIVLIYCGYIISGIIMYMVFGMSFFDALNHSITAVATGGFSTHSASIGFFNVANGFEIYQTIGIEVVSMVLMLLGATNFIAHLYLFKGKFKKYFLYGETKLMAFILAVCIPVVIVIFAGTAAYSASEAIRIGTFQVVSAFTTTGFSTIDFIAQWGSISPAIILILIILMLIGGQTNSTAGAIKLYRVNIFFKSVYIRIRNSFSSVSIAHPDSINEIDGKTYLTKEMMLQSNTFVLLYMSIFFFSVIVFTMFGYPLDKSAFEVSTLLGTVGIGCGIVAATLEPFLLVYASLIMFLGRLEIYVVIYAIIFLARIPFNWKKNRIYLEE